MKINDISLPYPVLGISDDVLPLLKKDCVAIDRPTMTATSLQFKIRLKQKNKEISKFIRQGRAEYVWRSIAQGRSIASAIISPLRNLILRFPERMSVAALNSICLSR